MSERDKQLAHTDESKRIRNVSDQSSGDHSDAQGQEARQDARRDSERQADKSLNRWEHSSRQRSEGEHRATGDASEWRREMEWVRLEDVSDLKGLGSRLGDWQRTQHGYLKEDLADGLRNLPEVRQRLSQGWTSEQFREGFYSGNLDDRRISRTYSSYYGHDRIKMTHDSRTGKLQIENGEHRVDLARQLGVDAIPAEVSRRN